MNMAKNDAADSGVKKYLKRGGILVFMLFLLKGIGWLVLFGLLFFGLLSEETVQRVKEAVPFF